MVYKIFVVLLAVNLFAMIAKAEAAEFTSNANYSGDASLYETYGSDINRYGSVNGYSSVNAYSRVAGDDEILIEKDVSKSKCILRAVSMLGSQWFNDTLELQRMKNAKEQYSVANPRSSFTDHLAQARYGFDMGLEEVSVSMKMYF
jgi:hypothetical protein